MTARALRITPIVMLTGTLALLSGCGATPPRPEPHSPGTGSVTHPGATAPGAPSQAGVAPPPPPPATLLSIPDAIPQPEPRSRNGNPPFYEVFGKRYFVLSSATGYVERGVASWYGPGFHEIRTSTGEPYDMYAMTAAHRTLPLPAYVRVTNLQNGRSVVVRVNDRGPFVGNRIIDLSYTAAAKLDMLRDGTAIVEVRALEPGTALAGGPAADPGIETTPPPTATPNPPPPPPARDPATGRALFIQAGAFADPANAERMVAKLKSGHYGEIFVRDDKIAGRRMYRVRIGPVPDVATFDRIVSALERAGIPDAHLALN
jgi:rare lipoprotein A